MHDKPNPGHRRSIRLPGYDYSGAGAYFVTLCTHERLPLFGQVTDSRMVLSELGLVAQAEWLASAQIRQELELDAFVVMPNHLHAIVWIVEPPGAHGRAPLQDGETVQGRAPLQDGETVHGSVSPLDGEMARGRVPACGAPVGVGAHGRAPLQRPARSLGSFVAGYKAAVTKRVNQARGTPGEPVWQRNYWEHIVRTERALQAIRQYIPDNPSRWELDAYNPAAISRDPSAAALWRLMQEQVP